MGEVSERLEGDQLGEVSVPKLLEDMRREFPNFRIIYKRDSRLSKVIDVALRVVTFGHQRLYMTHYHTVIGDTLYVPERWDETSDEDKWITLIHERVHLRQRRRMGTFWMAVVYLLPILPLGLAYGRARIEWEAYRETMRATAHVRGLEVANSDDFRAYIIEQFTSGSYGWMWPFPRVIHRWMDEVVEQMRLEVGNGPKSGATK